MPSIAQVVRRFTKQTLVYWEKAGSDPYGKPVFADPVEVLCRWEDKQQEIVLPDKRITRSDAYILSTAELKVGSMVFLGTIDDWKAIPTFPNIPTLNQGGREVILLKRTPDLRATSNVYEAYL